MLKFIRKKGLMKKILWVIAVGIILSFGLMGQSYLLQSDSGPGYAGKIFGRKVSFEDFESFYQQTAVQAMILYGTNFDKVREFLNLEAETWDRMILLREADRRKIRATNEEVVQAIKDYKFFQRDGQFDKILYDDVMRYILKVKVRDFEEGVRNSLRLSKLYDQVTAQASLTEDELLKAFQEQNEKVQVSYVTFKNADHAAQIPVDEAKAEAYYTAHQEEFAEPERITIEYLRFDLPPTATDKDKAIAKAEAEEAVREIKEAKNDLAAVAAKHSWEVKTSEPFSLEQPNLGSGLSFQVLRRVASLPEGDISAAIETTEGYQIVKMKKRDAGFTPAFAQIKDKVIEAWRIQEAKSISKQVADEYLGKLEDGFRDVRRPDFVTAVKALGLNVEQTPPFARGQYLPSIGIGKDFQNTAFTLTEDSRMSKTVEIPQGYAILFLDSREAVDLKDFENRKQELANDLLLQKKNSVFTDFLTRLRLRANLEDKISDLVSRQNASVDQ